MYAEDQLLNLKGSATYLCNNLDVVNSKDETTGEQINVFTIVHKAEVELVHTEVNGGGVSRTQRVSCRSDHGEEPVIITQARWCVLTRDKVLLVVTTYVGFQIFNSSGTTLLMKYELSQASMHGPDGHFCRGIANHGNKIFIGTSSGGVLVLNDMKITGELCSATTSSPVCDIQCSKSGHVAVSDEGGLITLWQPNHQENTVFGWKGVPCVSIGIYGDVLVAGFSTGHLRLYSMSQASLLVEITAHAQTVMSLDVDVASRKLLTVSEDCTLALWELPGVGETQVMHLFSQQIPNKQLCGARFLGSEDRFALTAYDWNEIILYKRT